MLFASVRAPTNKIRPSTRKETDQNSISEEAWGKPNQMKKKSTVLGEIKSMKILFVEVRLSDVLMSFCLMFAQ